PHHTPFPEVETSHPTTSSIPLPSIPTVPIPPVTQPVTTPIIQYLKRTRIAQSSALPTVADEPASPVRDVNQDRATIVKSSTLPHDSAPRVTSHAADEGREAATERISNDSEESARVLTSIDAATVLAGGIDVPTGSGFIPTAGPPATVISTGSEVGPTTSPIVTRRKGKEVIVESNTPKKKKLQEQIDAQVTSLHPSISSIPLSSIPTAPIPPVTQTNTTPSIQYTRRARISQSSTLPTVADEPASPVRDDSQGEACPTDSGFIADQDRATIAKSSTLPCDSVQRVTSPAAEEGISTGSEVGPTASPIVRRRKGKEVMMESDTRKKKKLQEQIDAQVARELEEQQ
nr:hypothetical protein [Tanacetum cinerariifolium]